MVRERRGKKARKAQRSDHFHQEWAAHVAAVKEEERDVELDNDDLELIQEMERRGRKVVKIIA
jgi:hypothetical protein